MAGSRATKRRKSADESKNARAREVPKDSEGIDPPEVDREEAA